MTLQFGAKKKSEDMTSAEKERAWLYYEDQRNQRITELILHGGSFSSQTPNDFRGEMSRTSGPLVDPIGDVLTRDLFKNEVLADLWQNEKTRIQLERAKEIARQEEFRRAQLSANSQQPQQAQPQLQAKQLLQKKKSEDMTQPEKDAALAYYTTQRNRIITDLVVAYGGAFSRDRLNSILRQIGDTPGPLVDPIADFLTRDLFKSELLAPLWQNESTRVQLTQAQQPLQQPQQPQPQQPQQQQASTKKDSGDMTTDEAAAAFKYYEARIKEMIDSWMDTGTAVTDDLIADALALFERPDAPGPLNDPVFDLLTRGLFRVPHVKGLWRTRDAQLVARRQQQPQQQQPQQPQPQLPQQPQPQPQPQPRSWQSMSGADKAKAVFHYTKKLDAAVDRMIQQGKPFSALAAHQLANEVAAEPGPVIDPARVMAPLGPLFAAVSLQDRYNKRLALANASGVALGQQPSLLSLPQQPQQQQPPQPQQQQPQQPPRQPSPQPSPSPSPSHQDKMQYYHNLIRTSIEKRRLYAVTQKTAEIIVNEIQSELITDPGPIANPFDNPSVQALVNTDYIMEAWRLIKYEGEVPSAGPPSAGQLPTEEQYPVKSEYERGELAGLSATAAAGAAEESSLLRAEFGMPPPTRESRDSREAELRNRQEASAAAERAAILADRHKVTTRPQPSVREPHPQHAQQDRWRELEAGMGAGGSQHRQNVELVLRQLRNIEIPVGQTGQRLPLISTESPVEKITTKLLEQRMMAMDPGRLDAILYPAAEERFSSKLGKLLASTNPILHADDYSSPGTAFELRMRAFMAMEDDRAAAAREFGRQAAEQANLEAQIREFELMEGGPLGAELEPSAGGLGLPRVKVEPQPKPREVTAEADAAAAAAAAEAAGALPAGVLPVTVKREYEALVANAVGGTHLFSSGSMRRAYANERATIDGITPSMRLLATDILLEAQPARQGRLGEQPAISFGTDDEIAKVHAALYANFGLASVAVVPAEKRPAMQGDPETLSSLMEATNRTQRLAQRKVIGGMECSVLIATDAMRALKNVEVDATWLEQQVPAKRGRQVFSEMLRGTIVSGEAYKGEDVQAVDFFFGGSTPVKVFNKLVKAVNGVTGATIKNKKLIGGIQQMSEVKITDPDNKVAFFVKDMTDLTEVEVRTQEEADALGKDSTLKGADLSKTTEERSEYMADVKMTATRLKELVNLWSDPDQAGDEAQQAFVRTANALLLKLTYSSLFVNTQQVDQLLEAIVQFKKKGVGRVADDAANENAQTRIGVLKTALETEFEAAQVNLDPMESEDLRMRPEVMEELLKSLDNFDFQQLPALQRAQIAESLAFLYVFIEHMARLRFLTAIPYLPAALDKEEDVSSGRFLSAVSSNLAFQLLHKAGYVGLFAGSPPGLESRRAARRKQKRRPAGEIANEAAEFDDAVEKAKFFDQARTSAKDRAFNSSELSARAKRSEFNFVMRQPVMLDGRARRIDFSDVCLLVDLILRMPSWEPVAANIKQFVAVNEMEAREQNEEKDVKYSWTAAIRTMENCYNVERNLRLLCSSNKARELAQRDVGQGMKLWRNIMKGKARGTENVRPNLITSLCRTIDDGGGPRGSNQQSYMEHHLFFALAALFNRADANNQSRKQMVLLEEAVKNKPDARLDDVSGVLTAVRNMMGEELVRSFWIEKAETGPAGYVEEQANYVLAHHYLLQVLINLHWHLNELPVTKHQTAVKEGRFDRDTGEKQLPALARIESVIQNLVAKIANHTRLQPTHANILRTPDVLGHVSGIFKCVTAHQGSGAEQFDPQLKGRTIKGIPPTVVMTPDNKANATIELRLLCAKVTASTASYPGSNIDVALRFAICVGTILFPEWLQVPDIRTVGGFDYSRTVAGKLLTAVPNEKVFKQREQDVLASFKAVKEHATDANQALYKEKQKLLDTSMEQLDAFGNYFLDPSRFIGVFAEGAQKYHSGLATCDPTVSSQLNGDIRFTLQADQEIDPHPVFTAKRKHPLFGYATASTTGQKVTMATEKRVGTPHLHWLPLPEHKDGGSANRKVDMACKTHAIARLELLIDELTVASEVAKINDPVQKRAWQFLRALVYIRCNSGQVRERSPFVFYRKDEPVRTWSIVGKEFETKLQAVPAVPIAGDGAAAAARKKAVAKPGVAAPKVASVTEQLATAVKLGVAPPFVGGRAMTSTVTSSGPPSVPGLVLPARHRRVLVN